MGLLLNRLSASGMAAEARQRGARFFEVELDVRSPKTADTLAEVEDVGFRLEHVGYAHAGNKLVGVYLFRAI